MTVARFVLLIIVVFVIAQATAMAQVFLAGYALLGIFVLSYTWARLNVRKLDLTRESRADHAQVGDTIKEEFSLHNRSLLPKFWVEVHDYSTLPGHRASRVISLPGRQSKQWRVKTPCYWRGRYTLGPLTLTTGDPLGIFKLRKHVVDNKDVIVYPQTVRLNSFAEPAGEVGGRASTRQRAPFLTPNVSGIRDYAPNDSFNRISWPATARLGRLVVKEFDLDSVAEVWLVLDLDEAAQVRGMTEAEMGNAPPENVALPDSTEEYGVMVTASVARYFLQRNLGVGMITWGQHHEVIACDRGERQFTKILEALAVARANGRVPLAELLTAEQARFGRNATVVVVTSSTDDSWVYRLRQTMQRGVNAIVVLVEPSTFGGEESALLVFGALASLDVPTYLVKRGEPLDRALERDKLGVRSTRSRGD
ncbi:MAG: DUF58 domain-containing protein [Chloroflexi bacterium]|nr:DUF58 domain-containing protein [Chloroflexota bacterium]